MSARIAILDMYNGIKNQGMGNIIALVKECLDVDYAVFDVRKQGEVPDTSFDIYISSGGPGDPRRSNKNWSPQYWELIAALWEHNKRHPESPKPAFFICHSFQMLCHHMQLGKITKRKKRSFGVFPVHKTIAGQTERAFQGLPDPFYIADFRDYQLVQPDHDVIEQRGARILALEKIRPHVPLERAIMAIRFSPYWIGTQFHPEAAPKGMMTHFNDPKERNEAIALRGTRKFVRMVAHINHPDRLSLTHNTILPVFLKNAVQITHSQEVLL
jgi:homoserine O-succinyltransferase